MEQFIHSKMSRTRKMTNLVLVVAIWVTVFVDLKQINLTKQLFKI